MLFYNENSVAMRRIGQKRARPTQTSRSTKTSTTIDESLNLTQKKQQMMMDL